MDPSGIVRELRARQHSRCVLALRVAGVGALSICAFVAEGDVLSAMFAGVAAGWVARLVRTHCGVAILLAELDRPGFVRFAP